MTSPGLTTCHHWWRKPKLTSVFLHKLKWTQSCAPLSWGTIECPHLLQLGVLWRPHSLLPDVSAWQWLYCTPVASTVTRSQSNRAHLECARKADLHHWCAVDKTAATEWFIAGTRWQNEWRMPGGGSPEVNLRWYRYMCQRSQAKVGHFLSLTHRIAFSISLPGGRLVLSWQPELMSYCHCCLWFDYSSCVD